MASSSRKLTKPKPRLRGVSGHIHRSPIDLVLHLQHDIHGILLAEVDEAEASAAASALVDHHEAVREAELAEVGIHGCLRGLLRQATDEALQLACGATTEATSPSAAKGV